MPYRLITLIKTLTSGVNVPEGTILNDALANLDDDQCDLLDCVVDHCGSVFEGKCPTVHQRAILQNAGLEFEHRVGTGDFIIRHAGKGIAY